MTGNHILAKRKGTEQITPLRLASLPSPTKRRERGGGSPIPPFPHSIEPSLPQKAKKWPETAMSRKSSFPRPPFLPFCPEGRLLGTRLPALVRVQAERQLSVRLAETGSRQRGSRVFKGTRFERRAVSLKTPQKNRWFSAKPC